MVVVINLQNDEALLACSSLRSVFVFGLVCFEAVKVKYKVE